MSFNLLIGRNMSLKDDSQLLDIVKKLMVEDFQQERSQLRDEAKENILRVQKENRKTFNRRRKPANKY